MFDPKQKRIRNSSVNLHTPDLRGTWEGKGKSSHDNNEYAFKLPSFWLVELTALSALTTDIVGGQIITVNQHKPGIVVTIREIAQVFLTAYQAEVQEAIVCFGLQAGEPSKASPPCVVSNTRCGCLRDARKANEFLANDYEASEHTRSYIGEWHTHPEPNPSPSPTDYHSLAANYHSSQRAYPFLAMIIVGTERFYTSIYNGALLIESTFEEN